MFLALHVTLCLLSCAHNTHVQNTPSAPHIQLDNPHVVTINTEYDAAVSIDYGSKYLNGWDTLTPIILTNVRKDGKVSVCSYDNYSKDTYIYEYSKDMKHIKTLKIHNEYEKFGSFAADNEGNYFFFTAAIQQTKTLKTWL